jgi:hypothetical protein
MPASRPCDASIACLAATTMGTTPTMSSVSQKIMRVWFSLGPRYLPFADAATPDLPLSRLLRLSLFQVSVGMALVLLVGTLNRVMIVELDVPAAMVAVMISLPLLFAPFRAVIGFRSDTHRSALGWRRVPYIWQGTMLQFGGLAIMPFALLVMTGEGQSGPLAGELFHLTEDVTTIGRIDGNAIVIQDDAVSKRHAGIKIEDMRYELADFNSTSGTWVTGRKINKQFLKDGDEIRIGNTEMTFTLK